MVNSLKNNIRKWLIKALMPMGQIFLEVIKISEKKKHNISNRVSLENIPIKGEDIDIKGEAKITHPRNVVLGSNVHIGNNTWLYTLGGLIIGDNVHISRNVTIYTANHNYNGAIPYDSSYVLKPVVIKKNTWIGINVSITPGVTIGEGVIIGMGAVISKDVPDFTIVGNQSHKILKERDKNIYQNLVDNELYGGKNGRKYNYSKKLLKIDIEFSNIVFVVGTGRSGTMTMASILDNHSDIYFKHELSEQLLRISTDFEYGNISFDKTKELLAEIYLNNTVFPNKKIIGESNQKLGNLIPILIKLFPKAKFIWLKRDGKKIVSSTYSRGWYKETNLNNNIFDLSIDKWENFRLRGDLVKEFSKEEWKLMTRFKKNCWYYAYWSNKIENGLEIVPKKQQLTVDLENLSNELINISEFLGVDFINNENKIFNKSKNSIHKYDEWTREERDAFYEICEKYSNK